LVGGSSAVSAFSALAAPPSVEAARPEWMQQPGTPMRGYGSPSIHERDVQREVMTEYPGAAPAAGVSFTPLQALRGRITPNGLHFERHHSGVPDVDPRVHRLLIHGLVERPLVFSVESLLRYPQISRVTFLECSGNSFWNTFEKPLPFTAGKLHGLLSCSEWTGVPLGVLLDEAGVSPDAGWLVAEGADSGAMVRSIPLEKARDDALIALYQNGERLRPEQGYPVRLLLPGWEGNMSVKWLRRLEVSAGPVHSRDETSKYADLLPDGTSRQFTFAMGVKSLIQTPSGGMQLPSPGLYAVEGVAWSGAGRIRRVEVSADGGASWAPAKLDSPVEACALTRFRIPWRWTGGSQILMSRAVDETGAGQPTREAWRKRYAPSNTYHYNAIQTWRIDDDGSVHNVYG
jgi:sulfane dehydrogenase subunit SoxC